MRKRLRRALQVAGVVVFGLVLGFGAVQLLIFGVLFGDPFDDRDFDRDVWMAHSQDWRPDNPRGQMAQDLRDRLLRERPSRSQVIELLGPPRYQRPDRISYYLGSWGFGPDCDWLEIYFGEDDAVVGARIARR